MRSLQLSDSKAGEYVYLMCTGKYLLGNGVFKSEKVLRVEKGFVFGKILVQNQVPFFNFRNLRFAPNMIFAKKRFVLENVFCATVYPFAARYTENVTGL
mgnify:CR=1 FL=1